MRKFTLTIIALITISLSSVAQLALGFKAGCNLKSLKFDNNYMTSNYEPGYTVGGMIEYSSKNGLGFDASIMFSQEYLYATFMTSAKTEKFNFKTECANIPLNIKWKIDIPNINHIAKPMIYTGPELVFVLGNSVARGTQYQRKSFSFNWNLGLGVELYNNVQICAHYGFGLSDFITSNYYDAYNKAKGSGKQNYFIISAAYILKL